jgi:hypothetical protein
MRGFLANTLAVLASFAAGTAGADGFEASFADGLRWRSAGDELELHAGGAFAADALWQSHGHRPGSQLRVDLAALELEASYRRTWFARIVGDLEGTKTAGNLYEASLAWRPDPRLRISAGLMPLALGYEAAIAPEDLSFVGHSYSRFLAYRTDWALRVELELAEGLFAADAAYALGDGFDANGEPRRDSQLQGRLFVRPLRALAGPNAGWLASIAAGFFFGGGYAHTFDYRGELEIRSPVGTELFDTVRFEADSSRFYTVVAGFEVGPLRMFYEGTQGGYFGAVTPVGTRDLEDQTDSWQAQLSWMLTGESYDGRLLAEPPRRGPNAWELALRYANGDIDRDFFAFALTSPAVSSQEFRSLSVALNWYATVCARISVELVHTQADDDIANLDGDGVDDAVLVRVQYRF